LIKKIALLQCSAWYGPVAQWLEQGAHNALVAGSIPAWPTTKNK
jgi:hypothetical protein